MPKVIHSLQGRGKGRGEGRRGRRERQGIIGAEGGKHGPSTTQLYFIR